MREREDLRKATLEELLALYQKGSMAAFNEMFTRTKQLVYGYLVKGLRNQADADDVFQEVYIRIHRYVSSYDPSRGAATWIISIARHAMIDRMRSQRRDNANVELNDELTAVDRTDEISFIKSLAEDLFKGLAVEDVKILTDKIFKQESYEAIAETYGLSVSNARQKVSRLLRRLKQIYTAS